MVGKEESDYIRAYNAEARRQAALSLEDVARLDRALAEVTRKLKKWYETVETGRIALEDVAERLQELKEERQKVEGGRRELLRKQHSAEEEVVPAPLIRRFVLVLIEQLRSGGSSTSGSS